MIYKINLFKIDLTSNEDETVFVVLIESHNDMLYSNEFCQSVKIINCDVTIIDFKNQKHQFKIYKIEI